MSKRRALFVGAALLVGAAAFVALRPRPEEKAKSAVEVETPLATTPARPASVTTSASESTTEVDPEFVDHLRSRYGAHIANPYAQVKMLEQLMGYFQKRDPAHWKEALLAVVRAAFPERYDEIAAKLDKRLEYERWAKDNRARLSELDPEERRAETWKERERLFGKEAAADIWASELKNQEVVDALKSIDTQQGVPIGDKLSSYKKSLEDIYKEKYDSYLSNHRHEAMNRFLSLESVQAELDAMSASEREQKLRDVREGMGLDEAAQKRWESLDHERDLRWEAGKRYMAEREALAKSLTGKELEQRLAELRARYFGGEAEVIAAEEASGLFRYGQKRRWGQN